MRKYDETSVVRILVNKGCIIDTSMKVVEIPKSAIIGIHSLGKIDYLTHYCGYRRFWTTKEKNVKSKSNNDNNSDFKFKDEEHKLKNKKR